MKKAKLKKEIKRLEAELNQTKVLLGCRFNQLRNVAKCPTSPQSKAILEGVKFEDEFQRSAEKNMLFGERKIINDLYTGNIFEDFTVNNPFNK